MGRTGLWPVERRTVVTPVTLVRGHEDPGARVCFRGGCPRRTLSPREAGPRPWVPRGEGRGRKALTIMASCTVRCGSSMSSCMM